MLAEIIKLINITGQDHQSRYHGMTDGVLAKEANELLSHFQSHSPKDMLMTIIAGIHQQHLEALVVQITDEGS